MKHFAAIAFLLFCGQALAQTQPNSLEFTSSESIEANSTSKVTCKINSLLVPKDTPNLKVVVSANISNNIVQIGEWSLLANNEPTNWNVSFKSENKNVTEINFGIDASNPSYNLTTSVFQLDLKLNKDNAESAYFCSLEKITLNKTETLLTSKTVKAKEPIFYAELITSTTKFTIDKQFNVNCKTVSKTDQNTSEIVQVDFFKDTENLATYELDASKNNTLSFTKHKTTKASKALEVSEGDRKEPTVYKINVKPLTKDAAGKYSCVATSKTIVDKTDARSYESNIQQVNNSARWALPSITFLLVNLAIFLHF